MGPNINRFLIIEDNQDFREALVHAILSEFRFLEIEEAANGLEAFDKLSKLMPEIIFADMTLPGENGLELIRKIKRNYPGAIIVSMAYEYSPEYEKAAEKCGADYHISKSDLDLSKMYELLNSILPDPYKRHEPDRRKHPRYIVRDRVSVALRSKNEERIGRLLDISEGGLAHSYDACGNAPCEYVELGIYPIGNGFSIEGIRFQSICDTCLIEEPPYGSGSLWRQGVQFGHLIPEQITKLKYFLGHYTSGRAPSNR
jgi:DNA-binding NarL/FixJ family response regulator